MVKEYLIKGFVRDDVRLKNPDGRPYYFDELRFFKRSLFRAIRIQLSFVLDFVSFRSTQSPRLFAMRNLGGFLFFKGF
jgi:hypothetical protein